MTKLQPLVENIPELVLIAPRGQRHIRQVQSDHTLIEPPVIFVLAGDVVFRIGDIPNSGIGESVRRQEGAAAHAGVDIALQLQHLLLRNIIRHQSPGSTLCRQLSQIPVRRSLTNVVFLQHIDELREGRRHPYAAFVLYALISLLQRLLNDNGEVFFLLFGTSLVQIHVDGHERSAG